MTHENRGTQEKKERKSLLKKYDISLNQLDFDYIKGVKNVKEMEKIYKILKSNETGYYPELTQCAEEKLAELSPNNRLLRRTVPVISKDALDQQDKQTYLKDINDWKLNMDLKEESLRNHHGRNHVTQPIRKSNEPVTESEGKISELKSARTKVCDYKSWDNYDADKECLKIDIEQEKKQEDLERLEKLEREKEKAKSNMSLEEAEIEAIKDYVTTLAPEEREEMALKEKNIGNEFYNTHHLDKALRHYTRSIYMNPTAFNHNNRAATYLKQCKFSKALADLNIVIGLDPDNVKARYRRAICLQHKNEFQKALDDIRVVLSKEPNHVLARHLADQLREDVSSLPRKHRIKIKDKNGKVRIEEVTEEEMLTTYQNEDFIEVNDFGLPKVMCNCNGKYVNDPGIRHEEHVRFQHIRQRKQQLDQPSTSYQLPSTSRQPATFRPIVNPFSNSAVDKPMLAGGARRLEILELDSISEEYEETPSTACIVKDMRSNKDVKTSANLNIAQSISSNSDSVNELAKSDKMAWNESVKESDVMEEEEVEMEENVKEKCVKDNQEVPSIPIENSNEVLDMIGGGDTGAGNNSIVEMMEAFNIKPPSQLVREEAAALSDHSLGSSMPSVPLSKDLSNITNIANKNSTLEENRDLTKCYCSLPPKILQPYSFLEKWCEISKNSNSLQEKATILEAVCPIHLSKIFSVNLNEDILTDVLNCLCYLCDQNCRKIVILEYVRAVTKLQRFKIIICFVKKEVKMKIQNMLTKMGPIASDFLSAFH